MSNLEIARRATETARDQRADFGARALLDGLLRASAWVTGASLELRGALDARGAQGTSFARG